MTTDPRTFDDLVAELLEAELGVDVGELEREVLEVAGVEYLRRYYLQRSARWSARIHLIVADDPGRDLHDHPWDYCSLILHGGYREITPAGAVEYQAPTLLVRDARSLHRLELLDYGPALTYVVTGPVCRRWGFSTPAGWVRWDHYAEPGRYR